MNGAGGALHLQPGVVGQSIDQHILGTTHSTFADIVVTELNG